MEYRSYKYIPIEKVSDSRAILGWCKKKSRLFSVGFKLEYVACTFTNTLLKPYYAIGVVAS